MNKPLVNTADCNLVKYCIALHALKQVLLQFIKKQCEEHSYLNLEYIKSTCGVSFHTCRDCNLSSSCQTSAAASKCAQNGACDVLFQRLKSQHLTQHPNWSNVRWALLSSSPWQQMKSFITERGYEDVASIEDSGITAFVQICCNHCDVSQLVGEDIRVLKKIVETQDIIFQSETVRYTGEEINRLIQDIKSAIQIQSLNGTPGIQDNLDVLDKLLTEERLIVEDEILARLHVIANLNRSIASLEHERREAESSPYDYAKKICELSFIKRKHFHRLKTRFEEVDSCLHQQKQEFKKQEDNLLEHKSEAAKLGLNNPLQNCASGWKRTNASNDSYNMYMQGLQEDIHTDVKDVLNGVDKNGRSLIEVEEAVRTMHSLIRDHIAITQLEHGKLQDLLMKITTVGASNNEALSEELVNAGKGLLNGAQFTDSHKRQLQNALRHLLQSLEQDGNIVNRIGHGCMAIYICCPTVINLIALCEDFLSGKLRLLFQPLEDYLRTLPGHEEVAVVVDIFEKDYLNCIMPVIKHKQDIRLQALVSLAFGRNYLLQSTNMRAENEHVEILEDERNTTIKTEPISECVTEDGLKDADTNEGVSTKCEDYDMAFKDKSGLDKHIHEDIKPLGCPKGLTKLASSLDTLDHYIGKKVESYCRKQVEALLKKAANEHTGNKKQPKLPLIRIQVDYSGDFEPFNQHRLGQLFLDRVANPKDMIHFVRKKGMAANKQDGVDGELGDIHVSAACIEDMVNDYFSKADEKLQVLSETGIGVAIKESVQKDERDAIPNIVAYQLGKAQEERDLSEKEYTEVTAILEPCAQYGKIETLETLSDNIDMKTDNSKTIAPSKISGSRSLGSRNESSFTRKRGSTGGKWETSSTRGFRGKRGGRERNAVFVDMQKRSIKDSFLLEPTASGSQIPSFRSFQEAKEDTIDLTFSDDDNESAREKETAVIEPSGKQDNQLVGNIQYDSDCEDDAPVRKRTRTHVSGTSAQFFL